MKEEEEEKQEVLCSSDSIKMSLSPFFSLVILTIKQEPRLKQRQEECLSKEQFYRIIILTLVQSRCAGLQLPSLAATVSFLYHSTSGILKL